MRFRPCIDIHNGKVKQIVGGSLKDEGDTAKENYIADRSAAWYAGLYKKDGLYGGHVILLNPASSPYYEETRKQAMLALAAFPGGLQAGGGITPDNAAEYIEAGASHVIVTSYVFQNGRIEWENLKRLKDTVGKDKLVLDISCRKKDGRYLVVTDRWQKFTETEVRRELLDELSAYCGEFLVHGVDVEGKASGIEEELVRLLGGWAREKGKKVTYAGGIASAEDIALLEKAGQRAVDFTVGSALDLFGGSLPYEKVRRIQGTEKENSDI